MTDNETYAQRWAEAINETYHDDARETAVVDHLIELEDSEDETAAVRRVLNKAADALRNGIPATFTGPELDLVRHLMPAHEVDQSGAKRWVLDHYGRDDGGES